MPVIPAFKMQRQEIHEFEAKFQTSLGYTKLQTLSQKKKKKKKNKLTGSKVGKNGENRNSFSGAVNRHNHFGNIG
jgi:5-methylcytosine-specific restriction endonuclease McrBC GTP-binding regulatory subunit McrB